MNREQGAGSREQAALAGVTLVELLVALAILGLIAGVSGLALASLRAPASAEHEAELRSARAEAIQSGHEVVVDSVRFLPDGRAIGPGVDPLTGEPTREPQD